MAFLSNFIDRIICLSCALTLLQAPIFMSQYINTLNGAISESRLLYIDVEQQANVHGISVTDYLNRHQKTNDPVVRESGYILDRAIQRYQRHKLSAENLHAASIWARPLILIYNFDSEIAHAMQFEPGLPLTVEALVYAGLGLLMGMLLSRLLHALVPWKRRRGTQV